jgi:hypothetical protein
VTNRHGPKRSPIRRTQHKRPAPSDRKPIYDVEAEEPDGDDEETEE